MTFKPSEDGWCVSPIRQPHYLDQLIRSNAPNPMCPTDRKARP